MGHSHLKRIVAPKTWPIVRKTTAFTTRPKPKGQTLAMTLPVVVVMRDVLGMVQTAAQAKTVLRTQEVTLNGGRIYDPDSAVGFMDILVISKHAYRMSLNKNNVLTLVPVKEGEHLTIQKVTGKTSLRGGKVQINCASGINILVEKDAHKVGDSIAVDGGKITASYPLEKGACVIVVAGSHIGTIGTVENVAGDVLTIKDGAEEFTTGKKNVYVVGKGKPAVTLA